MTDVDDLFELRTNFLLGNYQAAINEGLGLEPDDEQQLIDRDVLVFRCYLAQGNHKLVLDEINASSAPAELLAIRLLARYLSTADREGILAELKELLGSSDGNATLQLVAGIIYNHEKLYDDAMRSLHQSVDLESRALLLQTYIAIGRIDQADNEIKNMQSIDDDATITQLAQAWVNCGIGGEKLREAYFIYQELFEKNGLAPTVLNGLAVCSMLMHDWDEAEKNLLQALEKDSKHAETLVNLIACYSHQQRSKEMIARYVSQLKSVSPHHPWVVTFNEADESFDRAAAHFCA
eukprot:TRINITY_DN5243_c0_g3_i1.p1 TRINITY_DN5243_c0_g3~~TRINITY_DN5243_c0_g3_i1.p1  ORF type:complete len:322 (+),score=154.08 TRINITY_DN5243_c0_g3_i1:88-966(+)